MATAPDFSGRHVLSREFDELARAADEMHAEDAASLAAKPVTLTPVPPAQFVLGREIPTTQPVSPARNAPIAGRNARARAEARALERTHAVADALEFALASGRGGMDSASLLCTIADTNAAVLRSPLLTPPPATPPPVLREVVPSPLPALRHECSAPPHHHHATHSTSTPADGDEFRGQAAHYHAACSTSTDSDERCVIDLERMEPGQTVVRLPCLHVFHAGCILPYLNGLARPACPIDRAPVDRADIARLPVWRLAG